MRYIFEGFDLPCENWSEMPNELLAAFAENKATRSCILCVLYVLRHTRGNEAEAQAESVSLSIDEFMNGRKRKDGSRMDSGTGLSKPSAISGIREGVAGELLIEYPAYPKRSFALGEIK